MSRKVTIGAITGLALVALGLAVALMLPRASMIPVNPADVATLQDTVKTQVASASSQPPPSGGARDAGRVKEGVEYIIRDASGKIKEQKSIGGQ